MKLFKEIAQKLEGHKHSYWTPGSLDLAAWSQKNIVPNRENLAVFHTKVRARMVDETVIDVNKVNEKEKKRIEKVVKDVYKKMMDRDMIVVERSIGTNSKTSLKFRLYIPKDHPQIALGVHRNFFGCPEDTAIDIHTISMPDYPEKMTLVDPKANVTFVLGSDYYGEHKMSFLRLAMQHAREKEDSLGMHAGSKEYWVYNKNNKLEKKGALIFGLSGTGKTTITIMKHGLGYPERVRIRQDDISMLDKKGYSAGTERNFYIKTDSLLDQPELQFAATEKSTIIENVPVKYGGYAFDDIDFCSNGRALIPRYAIPNTDAKIDLESTDIIFFNTRRYDIPIIGRLTSPEQAATFFMLGESTQTSAGTENPDEVGKPMRVPGFDPFIIPPIYKNGERFYEIIKKNPNIQIYVVNTGGVGGMDNGVNIGPKDTGNAILQIVKDTVKWKYDENVGYDVPVEIPGTDTDKFDPYQIYESKEQYKQIMSDLREERLEYLKKFPKLSFVKLAK